MPTISTINGHLVVIYTADHRPAHVHVIGSGFEIVMVFNLNCPNEKGGRPRKVQGARGCARMTTKTIPWDAAKYLKTPTAQDEFLRESIESGDPAEIREAVDIVARAQNRNIGSDFNDFLAEEGILDEVTAATEQRVREWQEAPPVDLPAVCSY